MQLCCCVTATSGAESPQLHDATLPHKKMTTINWTTATGTALEVTVTTGFELNRQGVRKTSGERVVILSSKINGKSDCCDMGVQTVTGHATCIAKIGKIGLSAETLAPIAAAIATAKDEIAAHNADLTAHSANLDSLGNGDINTMFGCNA